MQDEKLSFADEYPFAPHYLEGEHGLRMHYVDEGKGPVVILLHACPMWSFEFRKLIRVLSSEYRVIAPDHVGYGLSDKPAQGHYDYNIENHADNLERLVEKLQIGKMSFVMHGLGATIGCAYMVRHPERVENIIIMNSMAFTGYRLPLRLFFRRALPGFLEQLFSGLDSIFDGQTGLPPNVRSGYYYPFRNVHNRAAIHHFIMDIPCYPEDDAYKSVMDIEHGLWTLRNHPILILWADRDWLYPLRYLDMWMEFFPEAGVRKIRRTGRYVTEEAPEEFVSTVHSFLKAHRT